MRKPAAVWRTLLIALAAGCGQGGAGPPPPDAPVVPEDTTQAPAAADTTPPPASTATGGVLSPAASAFPHAQHRGVRCVVCHTSAPPNHATHRDVECTACHGRPEGYAALPIRSPEDCQACHHGAQQETPCTTCHGPEAGGVVQVPQTLHLSRVTPPVERTLTLAHDRHASVACTTCHSSGVHYEVTRECSSCHENHHRGDADCLSCHQPAGDRHGPEAHLGCTGASCHSRPDIDELPQTRSLCLTCHPAQRTHEPGLECVQCHRTGRGNVGGGPPEVRRTPGAGP